MATPMEISIAMKRLTDAMPAPKGVDKAKAFDGYSLALASFSLEEIEVAIARYLAGEFTDLSLKFYPRPPEMGALCRRIQAERAVIHQRNLRAERQAVEQEDLGAIAAPKTPEQKARAAALMEQFHEAMADGQKSERSERLARNRANIRARYGMTDEAIASIKDRPLPAGMKSAFEAAPGIPEPMAKSQAETDAEELR